MIRYRVESQKAKAPTRVNRSFSTEVWVMNRIRYPSSPNRQQRSLVYSLGPLGLQALNGLNLNRLV